MIKNNKGFTLIELLVVVSIIGLLSTMAVVSLNSARAKARDAKRVSDVKQISTLIEMRAANTGSGNYNVLGNPCNENPADDQDNASTTCLGLFEEVDTSRLFDPVNDPLLDPCSEATGVNDRCNYSVATSSATGYKLCFSLESGAGNLPKGPASITKGGSTKEGCDDDTID